MATAPSNFFNGPNTRLVSLSAAPGPQDSASELDTLELHLGPVGWFAYAGINEFIRDRRSNFSDREIYRWIGADALRDELSVEYSRVPNILDTATTLITTDGMVAYQQRTRTGVDARPANLTSSVAENINRYKDDTPPGNHLELLRHSRRQGMIIPSEDAYQSVGVPHPFATVRRGISDELAPSVLEGIENGPFPKIQCTGISYDLDSLHPDVLFVACVPQTSVELAHAARGGFGERGSEWREGRLKFMPADFRHDKTARVLMGVKAWNPGGHASVVRAIELLRAVRREHSCDHVDAMRFIGTAE